MSKTNTSKILKSVALASALTAAGTVATTTAHADAATTNTAETQTPAASADQQLSNLKSQQTANENKVASSNAATMSAASDAANKQIADLNNQIVQRQNSDVASYQSEIASVNNDAKKATDAENASYSDAVTKQKAANDSELKSAQANIVTEQQKAQETKKENADFQDKSGKLETTHKQNLSKIDKDSQSATDEINGKIQKEIDKQKADYSQAIVDATKQVDAKINDANTALNQAQKAVNDDKADVNTKQSADDQAQSALKNAKQTLTSAQDALKQAQANQPVVNNINVSSDFINAWKEYMKIKKTDDWLLSQNDYPELFNKMKGIDKQELEMNAYKSDPIAKQIKVTLTANGTLSRDDIIKATQYAVQLLNPLREAIGTDPYKITNASIDVAQDIENGYRKDHFNMWTSAGHDVNLLKSVGQAWGVVSIGESWAGDDSFGSLRYDENTGKFIHDYSDETLDDLQRGIYDSIVMLLFKDEDQGFGHATDILGVRAAKADNMFIGDKLGVGFDYGQGDEGRGQINVGGFHFNTIADATSAYVQRMLKDGWYLDAADQNSKVNQGQYKEEIAIPKVDHNQSLQDLQTKVANDTQAVNDAQNKADASASALKDAKAKLDSDSTKLTQAQSKLNDLKANRDETIKKIVGNPAESPVVKKLQDQLTTVKNKHDENVKAENQQYEAQLSDLKKNHEANLAKIAAQPTNVDELKSQLQAKLDSLKKDHEAKLAQIQDEANAKIADIKKQASANDPEIDKLQAKISEIKDNLAQQQKTLDDQFAALKAKDEAEYNDLKSKLEGSSSETVKGNNNHYNTSDGQHEVILPSEGSNSQSSSTASINNQAGSSVATNISSLVAGQSGVKAANNATAQNAGKALPQTGSETGIAAILLGAMAAMFSFGFAAKKRY